MGRIRGHLLSFPRDGFSAVWHVSLAATVVAPGRVRKWLFAGGEGRMEERMWLNSTEFGDAMMDGPDFRGVEVTHDQNMEK